MDTYLVGGAVRDALLGREVTDRDWVVVGATPAELLRLGYEQVGADFPVFLHPDSKEEYALARTERKIGVGHRGFEVHFDADVTLEEDLARRDLTINAIAQDANGDLIDPFGGRADLEAGILRAVTQAFREDPLRVLRVARFAAQLPGFAVAEETRDLMRDMCSAQALAELPGERVWQELVKVLSAPAPGRFFEVVRDADAWQPFLVELEHLSGDALPELEGDARFAGWCEGLDQAAVRALCGRIKAPNRVRDFALAASRYGAVLSDWARHAPEAVAGAVSALRGYHDAMNLAPMLDYLQVRFGADASLLEVVAQTNTEVRAADFSEEGAALGLALMRARADRIAQAQRLR